MNKEEREIVKYKKKLQAQQQLVGDDAESPTLYRKDKVGRSDPEGLVDTSLWYSDGHLVKPEHYKE